MELVLVGLELVLVGLELVLVGLELVLVMYDWSWFFDDLSKPVAISALCLTWQCVKLHLCNNQNSLTLSCDKCKTRYISV